MNTIRRVSPFYPSKEFSGQNMAWDEIAGILPDRTIYVCKLSCPYCRQTDKLTCAIVTEDLHRNHLTIDDMKRMWGYKLHRMFSQVHSECFYNPSGIKAQKFEFDSLIAPVAILYLFCPDIGQWVYYAWLALRLFFL